MLRFLRKVVFFYRQTPALSLGLPLLLASCLRPGVAIGQESRANTGAALLVRIGYGAEIPGGDLADRFGQSFSPNLGIDYLTEKQNWIIGFEGQFIFGNEVKQDVLAGLRTEAGFIIGNDQLPADIQLRQRGFYLGGHIGKLFGLSSRNPRSALRITLGIGFLEHRIRIQEDPNRTVIQLTGDYEKGYDQLSNGLALQQFIGYQYQSLNGRINFYAGFECTQGFTAPRRSFDFASKRSNEEVTFDLLYGLRVGWILPFYFGEGREIYY